MQMEVEQKFRYAVVAAVQLPSVSDMEFEASLTELRELAKTLGFKVIHTFIQKRNSFDTTGYLGVGKRQEIRSFVHGEPAFDESGEPLPFTADATLPEIDAILVDHEISPSQARNLEIEAGCMVMESSHTTEASLDIRTSTGSRVVVSNVISGGSGYEGGLNVNDEIIAVDNLRVDESTLSKLIASHKVGDEVSVLISRDNIMRTLKIKLKGSLRTEHTIRKLGDKDKTAETVLDKWMN